MRNIRLVAAWLAVASAIVGPALAQDARLVELSKSDSILSYWDLNSVKPVGDGFDVQTVEISYAYSMMIGSSDVAAELHTRRQGLRISCGWRTVQYAGRDGFIIPVVRDGPPSPDGLSAPIFLSPDKPYGQLADLLCGGGYAGKSGLTQPQALAQAKAVLVKEPGAPPPLPVLSRPTLEAEPAWVGQMHRFDPLPAAPKAQGRTYIDAWSIADRDGGVEAVALVVLRPSRSDASLEAHAAEMRLTRYDCRQKTLTVQASALWNGYGALIRLDGQPAPPRAAVQSPAIAQEIKAACGPFQPDGAPVSDVQTAIAANQPQNAPSPRAWTVACLWDGLTPEQRVRWIDMWEGRDRDVRPELRGELPVAETCGVPARETSIAAQALRLRGIQYSATQRLTNRYGALFEQRVLAIWNGLPETERRRFALPWRASPEAEREFQTTLVVRVAKAVGMTSPDDANVLAHYLKSLATLQVTLRATT